MNDETAPARSRRPLVPSGVQRADDRRLVRRRRGAPEVAGFRPAPTDRHRWRNVQALLGVMFLLGVALAASVMAYGTLSDLLRTGDRVVDDYADGRTGRTVRSTTGGFTAVFPARPQKSTEAVVGDSERLSDQLVVSVGGADFSVSWFDLDSEPEDPAAVLGLLGPALARDRQATIGDRGTLRGDTPQHDFVLAVGTDRTILVRHLIAGKRVFQVEVGSENPLDKAFTRFANSVEPETG